MRVQDLDRARLRYVWDHRRSAERLEHFQLAREGLAQIQMRDFLNANGKVAIRNHPILAWGFRVYPGEVGTWFLRTPQVDRHWLWVTRTGRRFVRDLQQFGLPVTLNGSREPEVARWYGTLGFAPVKLIGSRWAKYVLEDNVGCVGQKQSGSLSQ